MCRLADDDVENRVCKETSQDRYIRSVESGGSSIRKCRAIDAEPLADAGGGGGATGAGGGVSAAGAGDTATIEMQLEKPQHSLQSYQVQQRPLKSEQHPTDSF